MKMNKLQLGLYVRGHWEMQHGNREAAFEALNSLGNNPFARATIASIYASENAPLEKLAAAGPGQGRLSKEPAMTQMGVGQTGYIAKNKEAGAMALVLNKLTNWMLSPSSAGAQFRGAKHLEPFLPGLLSLPTVIRAGKASLSGKK